MRKQIQKVLSMLLCLVTGFSVVACSGGGEDSSLPTQSQGNSVEDTSSSLDSTFEEEGGDSSDGNLDEDDDEEKEEEEQGGLGGEVEQPDPDKVLDREEVDGLGHKIAYYTDGTWEDLGRVTPLDFTTKGVETRLGYKTLASSAKGAEKQAFYAELFDAALQFSQSSETLASESVSGTTCYILAKVGGEGYTLTNDEMIEAWRTMRQDYPEFYWMSTQIWLSENKLWMCVDEEYADGATRAELKTKIQQAVLECDSYLNGKMSQTELAVTINDYLTANVTYSYESDGVTPSDEVWAHNIVGWAEKDLGVCETYAESYAYLCDLFGLECWAVTGVAAQTGVMSGHAWNILKLDGEWYNVDVTWNDGFETSSPQFLSREWFGMSATEFNYTHLADSSMGVGMNYQIPLPTLSEKSLAPVLFKDGDKEAVMVSSIDKAFEKMTNAEGMYEITLYPDSNAQADADKAIYPQTDAFTTATLPKAKEITFIGERYVTNTQTGAYVAASLYTSADVLLQSDLRLVGFELYANSLNLGANTLTLTEETALRTNVIGAVDSAVKVSAGDGYAMAQGIHVDTLELVSGDLYTLGALTAQTVYLHAGTLLVHQSAANVTIANLYTDYAGANIITTATTGDTEITLGNVGGIDGERVTSLMLDIRFTGMANYPKVTVTGNVIGRLVLAITGTVSEQNQTAITSNDFNGGTVAIVNAIVSQNEFAVGFTGNNTVNLTSYIQDTSNGRVMVW